MSTMSWTVDHPAATTTTYTVQGSNLTDTEIQLGQDDWSDLSDPGPLAKSAAEKFIIELVDMTCARYRLRAVTAGGSGTATVREHRKGWA